MKGAEKTPCDFGVKLCGKIKTLIVRVNTRLLTSQCSCQVLAKFCIDNSIAKVISLAVQIYLAGLAIANSFEKTASDW